MSDQLAIDFARTAARRTDPDTSHDAAVTVSERAAGHRARALHALHNAGPDGLTDFELAERTGIQQTSIGKRRGELCKPEHGAHITALIDPTTGRQQRRPSPTGTPAGVWIHTDHTPNRTTPE